jgi:hypothetical protein
MAGFTTDAAKRAAQEGNYELAAPLPVAPPTVTVRLPDGTADFSTLPAQAAVGHLRKAGRPEVPPNPTDALPITRIELGSETFLTDRGPLSLPAWLFHPVDSRGPVAWPALPPDAFWEHTGQQPSAIQQATLAADGRTLTVTLPAAPAPCSGQPPARHEPVVTESRTAAVVGVREIGTPGPPSTSGADCARDAMARYEPHQIQLAAPLGARVLVDQSGAPAAVTGQT